jgi:voltage-gated potassium channel
MIFVFFRMILAHRKLRITLLGLLSLVVIIVVSTFGFRYFEAEQNLSLFDSLWLSVVTMTTVGYGDVAPKTPAGRLLAMTFTMFCGIGVMAYLVSLLATSVIEREAKLVSGELELTCKNHILIINMPNEQMIHAMLDELRKDNNSHSVPIVLISDAVDRCPAQLLNRKNFYFVKGNPTWRATLQKANATEALQAVILPKDPKDPTSDGLTTQTAIILKSMHDKVESLFYMVAEVISRDSVEPLQLAGCHNVVCLQKVIPDKMAEILRERIAADVERYTGFKCD